MEFKMLAKDNILCEDFLYFKKNNKIEFSQQGVAVIYGPNGTGKTTLSNILERKAQCKYLVNIEDIEITHESENNPFYIIPDQNGRNIIKGETEDFILGDNIRREYELKSRIEMGFDTLFNSILIPKFKNEFGISTKNSLFHNYIKNKKIVEYISDLANNRSKGLNIDRKEFLEEIEKIKKFDLPDKINESKLTYLVNDYKVNNSIIRKVLALVEDDVIENPSIKKIEENDDAIKLLKKYTYIDECIVCDNDIDRELLLEKKVASRKSNEEALDEKTKKIFQTVIMEIDDNNPFSIKQILLDTINTGNFGAFNLLKEEFEKYFDIYDKSITNLFITSLDDTTLANDFKEFEKLTKEKQILTHEDALFIEKFVNDCIDKKIELKRDDNDNLVLLLGEKEFLNKKREELYLSNGEQNFISLSFELLKAKKVENPIIILDDPISSFDSIYKNKIAYAILKFLSDKKQIILTHNTVLIRLLEHQRQKCHNLYIMNNTLGEENGFIKISNEERKFLLYLHELLRFFREDVDGEIRNKKQFLMSVIPFMRGYSQITNKKELKNNLTNLMHGYNHEIYNVMKLYNQVFDTEILKDDCSFSAQNIADCRIEEHEIINSEKYPLLNKTLIHTLTYLFLRLNVERVLVNKFSINVKKYDLLNSIINFAFKDTTQENIEKRIFLLSRKTLLNEFNHFEVDMNIFQPAIDITNNTLKREKQDILNFLSELES